MLNVQTTDCRAKKAESLEQAKQSADEDLRHLYETIAKQWHLLAERVESCQARIIYPVDGADAPMAVSKIDASSDTTDRPGAQGVSEQILKAGLSTALASSDSARDDRTTQANADEGLIGIPEDQIRETACRDTQLGPDAKAIEDLDDQIAGTGQCTASAVVDDPVLDNIQHAGEVSPKSGRIESPFEWMMSCWFLHSRE